VKLFDEGELEIALRCGYVWGKEALTERENELERMDREERESEPSKSS
jgi:hypothetical protein